MALDAVLNLVWASIGVFGIAALAMVDRRCARGLWSRARRFAAVLVFAAALFPCVSLTDDYFLSSLLQADLAHHGGFGSTLPEDSSSDHAANLGLARALGSLGHVQITAIFSLVISLAFLGVVFYLPCYATSRTPLCRNGRDPPTV